MTERYDPGVQEPTELSAEKFDTSRRDRLAALITLVGMIAVFAGVTMRWGIDLALVITGAWVVLVGLSTARS